MHKQYYLSGVRNHLSEADAKDELISRHPAVARCADVVHPNNLDWTVYYLVSGPLQPGQVEFALTSSENERIVSLNG